MYACVVFFVCLKSVFPTAENSPTKCFCQLNLTMTDVELSVVFILSHLIGNLRLCRNINMMDVSQLAQTPLWDSCNT